MHCFVIICKYFSLGHKPDYQRSRFKYLPIYFIVSVIWIGFRFDKAKKVKSHGNSDDGEDQITGQQYVLQLSRTLINLYRFSNLKTHFLQVSM